MTDNVFTLSDYRPAKPPPSPQEVAAFCVEDVTDNWERHAHNNKLNDFFVENAGIYTKPFINYLSNLTEVALVEQKLQLMPGIWAPGINNQSQLGWRACFRFGDILIETPDMANEAYARCFNILVFLKVKRQMVTLSRPK